MPAARARDTARPDLAAVGDELPQGGDVLVIDELHLVAAVLAGLPAPAASSGLAIPPARRPAALLCHCSKTSLVLLLARRARRARKARRRGRRRTGKGSGPGQADAAAASASRRRPAGTSDRHDSARLRAESVTILRRNRRFPPDPSEGGRRLARKLQMTVRR